MKMHRYDEKSVVYSNLNPMEDVHFWIRGLRSKGLATDILREHHGVRDRSIKSRSVAISRHAETAVNLLEQGFEGPIETSFLPLYYGMLNLAKIYIICSDQYSLLRKKENKKHGATSLPHWGNPRNFLKDKILLFSKGTISIFYKTITGKEITNKNIIELGEVYPFIADISHEYSSLYKTEYPLQFCGLEIIKDESNGHFVRLTLEGDIHRNSNHSQRNQFLTNFNKTKDNRYETEKIQGDFEKVSTELKNKLKRFLLYEEVLRDLRGKEIVITSVPISAKRVLFPEELPILIAFFHLSTIVRYHPELLFELKDSPEWGMIQTLSRHGAYRFLTLFWSYIQQKSVFIHKK